MIGLVMAMAMALPVGRANAATAVDSGLCTPSITARLVVPQGFPLSVCFTGNAVTIKNTTDLMIDLRWQGTSGNWVLKADTVNAVSFAAAELDKLPYRLPPGYQATMPIGSQAAYFRVGLAPDNNRLFWMNLASSLIPGSVGIVFADYQALANFSDSIDSIRSSNVKCVEDAANFIADAACEAKSVAGVYASVQLLRAALLAHGMLAKTFGREIGGLVEHAINLAESDISLFAGNIQLSNFIGAPKQFQINPGSANPTTPTTPNSSSFAVQYRWSWEFDDGNGYLASGSLSTGSIAHLRDVPLLSGFTSRTDITADCSTFDPTTDGVIPVQVLLSNSTPNFPSGVSDDIYLDYTDDYFYKDLQVSTSDVGGGTGGSCVNIASWENQSTNGGVEGGPWTVSSSGNLAAGATTPPINAYLIISNYYTPNNPDGDPSVLASAVLALRPASLNPYVSFNGPGYQQGDSLHEGLMPLNGQTTSCDGHNC